MKTDKYLAVIDPLMRSFRADILSQYGNLKHDFKEDASVVTELDRAIERTIAKSLHSQFPDIGIVGEEFGQTGNSHKYWLIDPLDGTELFIRGLPGVTIIIGLVENGVATHSYIYDPAEDRLYSAVRGGGAFLNGNQTQVSTRPVGSSYIVVSSGLELTSDLPKKLHDYGVSYVTRMLGSGIRSTYMASGRIEGVIVKSQNRGGPWDHAPTRLLMEEAGAKLIISGEDMVEARVFALLSPAVYEELHELIEQDLYA